MAPIPSHMKTNPFATFLIIGPTCFFLGILFAYFPYDYHVLWTTSPGSREPYFILLENHLKFIHASPPLIARILHIVIGVALIGFITKLYKATESNMLFDGASLVLYMVGLCVYIANIVKGLRIVTYGSYGTEAEVDGDPNKMLGGENGVGGGDIIGREDSLKVLAASNTILALVLSGVLILQAGQWYAMKKEAAEIEAMDKEEKAKKAQKASETPNKKKQ